MNAITNATSSSTVLATRVRLINRAHDMANQLTRELRERFAPLVGTKVLTTDGTVLSKYKHLLPYDTPMSGVAVYRPSVSTALAWVINIRDTVEERDVNYGVTVWVGKLDRGVLRALYTNEVNHRTDYTVAEIEARREEYKTAERAYLEARDNLYPFWGDDR